MHRLYLILLLIFTLFFRFTNLGTPNAYVFDEVYHVPALRAIAENSQDSYDPFAKAPESHTAYDWLHPPVAKLFQAASVRLLVDHPFAWRFPSAAFGLLSVWGVYFLSFSLFKNYRLSLIAATLFSLDNMQLTMSRIAMNDIFVTTFILFALGFFFRRQLFLAGIFTGLSLATKHSAILLYPIYLFFLFSPKFKLKLSLKSFYFLTIIPVAIYFLSFSQFFLQGKTLTDFYQLHQQIYWYQTNLSATHDYQSIALSWPLLLRPVWLYVDYLPESVANIYNLGNPAVFWGGLILALQKFHKVRPFWLIYLMLFLPFQFSPRIMFLHHYLPALSILCILAAQAIYNKPKLAISYLILTAILFVFFLPLSLGIHLPTQWLKFWFWLPSWK